MTTGPPVIVQRVRSVFLDGPLTGAVHLARFEVRDVILRQIVEPILMWDTYVQEWTMGEYEVWLQRAEMHRAGRRRYTGLDCAAGWADAPGIGEGALWPLRGRYVNVGDIDWLLRNHVNFDAQPGEIRELIARIQLLER